MPVIRADLLPTTQTAMKLTKMIRSRIDFAYRTIGQKFPEWDQAEEKYRAYKVLDDEDRESLRKNQVQKIVVPVQFATLQTMLTFFMEVFTAMQPVLKVRGADPASVRPARVMELMLDYDYRGNRGYLLLYSWFLNALRYGYGVMQNSWGRRLTLKRTLKQGPGTQINVGGQLIDVPGAIEYAKDWLATFEGNVMEVVDPRQWFYDVRRPLARFQEGEFCGKRVQVHTNDLTKGEADGLYFNTSYVTSEKGKFTVATRDADNLPGSSRRDSIEPETHFTTELEDAKRRRMHVMEEIIIELIPRDWALSDEDRPEAWLFCLIDGQVLIRAEPSPFVEYPYAVTEPYPDVLTYMNQGVMELTEPLSQHLTFLFNSHMSNVRKAVNDVLIVDPSRINLADLLNPAPGKLVRLLQAGYGQDPAQFVKQLQVLDITRGHIEDSKAIMELWARITGVNDTMFGQISSGRRSATELQGIFRMSGSRLMMTADLFSAEGVAPHTQNMAITRQENMSVEQWFEIVGRSAAELGVAPEQVMDNWARLGPSHIAGVFRFPAEQGVMPQDRLRASEMYKEAFQAVAQAPFLAQAFDPVELFVEAARQGGIRDIEDFRARGIRGQVNIIPDISQIQDGVAGGRLKALNGTGRPVGRPDEGVRRRQDGLGVEGYAGGAGIPGQPGGSS